MFQPVEEDCKDPILLSSVDYKGYLARCNLFDVWTVAEETRRLVGQWRADGEAHCLVLIRVGSAVDGELCRIVCGDGQTESPTKPRRLDVAVEDTGGGQRLSSVEAVETVDLPAVDESRPRMSPTSPALSLITSYLRMLINSRYLCSTYR